MANWSTTLAEEKTVTIDTLIDIPSGYEGGDYHFLLYLTDVNGNQGWTGVSLKMQ